MSAAGRRAGIKDGTRSGLWAVFAEAIDALRPQYVVIENVRGLLSSAAHRTVEEDERDPLEPGAAVVGDGAGRPVLRALGAVLGDLSDIGYDAVWATVAASAVGAPHRRERVFIVGTPSHAGHDAGCPEQRVEHEKQTRRVGQSSDRVSGDEPGVALLPTPTQADWGRGSVHPDRRKELNPKHSPELHELARHGLLGGAALLPTPTTQDGANNGGPSQFQRNTLPLNAEVTLLPTPSTHDKTGARSPESIARMDKPFANLNDTVVNDLGVERGPEPVDVSVGEDDSSVPVLPGNGGGEDALVIALNGDGVAVDVCGAENSHSSCVPAELAGTKYDLLPTPAASDGARGPDYAATQRNSSSYHTMVTLAAINHWGKYAPAIARWERIVGPPPAPTEPNKNGNPRLSAAFSEWLMGWPAGWVTDPQIGISRGDQLRILGNGVVVQQAIAALRYLLAVNHG